MVSKKQISKTSAVTKVLTENLQNNDRLDIADLLNQEKDLIDTLLLRIQDLDVLPQTLNYIYNLVLTSNFILNNLYMDFFESEF